MTDCAYQLCINHASRLFEEATLDLRNVTYHPFPKDPELKEKWLKQMNQEGFEPSEDSALCSIHFHSDYFLPDSNQAYLKADAIPTDFELGCLKPEDIAEATTAVSCCAYQCPNSYSPSSPVTFHAFPLEQPDLCSQWLSAMNLNQINADHAVLCSEHFDDSCFVMSEDGQRLLIADAIPSIFQFPDENSDQQGTINYEITEEELELIRRHDGIVKELLEVQEKYKETHAFFMEFQKKKKFLDKVGKALLHGATLTKKEVKEMKPVLKEMDEKYDEIMASCLEPCRITTVDE